MADRARRVHMPVVMIYKQNQLGNFAHTLAAASGGNAVRIVHAIAVRIVIGERVQHVVQFIEVGGHFQAEIFQPILADHPCVGLGARLRAHSGHFAVAREIFHLVFAHHLHKGLQPVHIWRPIVQQRALLIKLPEGRKRPEGNQIRRIVGRQARQQRRFAIGRVGQRYIAAKFLVEILLINVLFRRRQFTGDPWGYHIDLQWHGFRLRARAGKHAHRERQRHQQSYSSLHTKFLLFYFQANWLAYPFTAPTYIPFTKYFCKNG